MAQYMEGSRGSCGNWWADICTPGPLRNSSTTHRTLDQHSHFASDTNFGPIGQYDPGCGGCVGEGHQEMEEVGLVIQAEPRFSTAWLIQDRGDGHFGVGGAISEQHQGRKGHH